MVPAGGGGVCVREIIGRYTLHIIKVFCTSIFVKWPNRFNVQILQNMQLQPYARVKSISISLIFFFTMRVFSLLVW
jgi:hypothetical protein